MHSTPIHHQQYLTFDELTANLRSLVLRHPEFCKLLSIGKSELGRELWVLRLSKHGDKPIPSVWVDGNMHATELCGSNVALEIAERILTTFATGNDSALPEHLAGVVENVRFFIMPRMCPDGAEVILKEARYVRSNPRDRRHHSKKARFVACDLDGDGLSLSMRVISQSGDYVESKHTKNLMVPRRPDDAGPYYKIYPEARIENFLGVIPTPHYLDENDTDLNRNFPTNWKAEPTQAGAGSFATSEPETRAVVEFTSREPTIFAWLNLHTFGGVFIRPLGDAADTKMNEDDLAIYRDIGAMCERETGYPMVSGFEEFLYRPDIPIYGDLTDYAYLQRGAIAYVCELWDFFKQVGISRKKPFTDTYTNLSPEDWEAFGTWDKNHNQSRVVRPWVAVNHPELGPVEVGGFDPRIGISNPTPSLLPKICSDQATALLRLSAMAPQVSLRLLALEVEGDAVVVSIIVQNTGYLPTYVLDSAKQLPDTQPLFAEFATESLTLVDSSQRTQEVGHLAGYGRGLYTQSIFFLRTTGIPSERVLRVTVRGSGALHCRVSSPRIGIRELTVAIGQSKEA
jgi:Zinc carboxypeptidase